MTAIKMDIEENEASSDGDSTAVNDGSSVKFKEKRTLVLKLYQITRSLISRIYMTLIS
jgi:hypothetical protein